MQRERLELALDLLRPAQWERFEQFASEFLTSDFPDLKTVASPSGDGGRDAQLYSPNSDPSVVFQYSVAEDWADKIKKTVKRLSESLPSTRMLVYITNQVIGAQADQLVRELRQNNQKFLEIKDRSWFLDRYRGDVHRESVAEALAQDVVDPYLSTNGVIDNKATALTSIELRAALLFLILQWEDDTREKGLTRLAFEALVRSVLRNTNSDKRISRAAIYQAIQSMFNSSDRDVVVRHIDASLSKLTKKYIRHWEKEDEFCLTHEETQRVNARLERYEVTDRGLQSEITLIVKNAMGAFSGVPLEHVSEIGARVRRVVEQYLYDRAELFASSMKYGRMNQLRSEQLRDAAIQDVGTHAPPPTLMPNIVDIVVECSRALLVNPSGSVQEYLKSLSDSYTLLAFLRQTPDVQSAIKKIFSTGEIWLDTSAVLPLFAESLVSKSEWRFTHTLMAASDVGLKLRISTGVIEELERHMNRAYVCSVTPCNQWNGYVPFLYSYYIQTGAPGSQFNTWLENFRGHVRPEDDIAEYLHEKFHIERGDIAADAKSVDPLLRNAVFEVWHDIHVKRREASGAEFNSMLTHRLANHDTDNYVGVLARRKEEKPSPFGYSSWWLTMDRMAFGFEEKLKQKSGATVPSSPVMSIDFLINYLALGPVRGRIPKQTEAAVPAVLDSSLVAYLTPELLQIAESVREESKDLPENVIRRRVRDALDAARRRVGPVATLGLNVLLESSDEQI